MKIVFLCGSLQPGFNGVGDYTRLLAGELIRTGNQVSIISLNDKHVTDITREQQQDGQTYIDVLRIPLATPAVIRYAKVKDWVESFDPEWLSLQFVPFSFHNKGLPFGLAHHLKKIGRGRKWHVMFHELWVGSEDGQVLKMKILFLLQQFIIKQILRVIKPYKIHTQLPFYKIELKAIGWQAESLSLFSNITRIPGYVDNQNQAIVKVGLFSQIEAIPEILDFLASLQKSVANEKAKLEILLIGGSEKRMMAFKDRIIHLENQDTHINYTGFLDPAALSFYLQSCTFGLTPIPRHALGKSGSVAAFFEHNIPVAAPLITKSTAPFFDIEMEQFLIPQPDFYQIKTAGEAAKNASKFVSLSLITGKFIKDLSLATIPLVRN